MSTTQDASAGPRPAATGPPGRPAAPARRPARGTLLGLRVEQMISWEVAAAAVLAARHYGSDPLLYAAAGGTAVVLVLTLVRRQGRWLYQWLGLRLAYRGRRQPVPVTDGPDSDGRLAPVRALVPALAVGSVTGRRSQPIGVLRDGDGWVAVLDLAGTDGLLPRPPDARTVPLGPLVAALSTEDIQLTALQLVVHTVPARSAAQPAQPPSPPGGPENPPALQAGWLALRISAATALDGAGRAAGTGKAGLDRVQRVLRRAVDRAVETLHGLGVAAHPLDEDGLRAALGLATAGRPATPGGPTEPATEDWTGWQCAGAGHTSYAVREWPGAGLAPLLGALATVPAQVVTLSVTVNTSRTEPALSGLIRITEPTIGAARQAGDITAAAVAAGGGRLVRLDGQQAGAVLATLPLGAVR